MEGNPMLSIIVPIYNLEQYLSKCIDSILCQTYCNFELILIDDGSTDSSYALCREYQEKDHRIRVFRQENGGVSSARNLGLENARGQYFSFVDGDDYIEHDMMERLLNDLQQSNADIACCQLDRITSEGKHLVAYPAISEACTADKIVSCFFDEGYIKECMYGPYNKVFYAECVRDIRFKPYRYGEDLLFVFETLQNAKKVYIDRYVGYHYVEREGSAVKSKFSLGRLDYVKAAREVEQCCQVNFPPYEELAHRWVYRHVLITVWQLLRNGMMKEQKDYISNEKTYLKTNASYLIKLPFRFRAYYWLVMYYPSSFFPVFNSGRGQKKTNVLGG